MVLKGESSLVEELSVTVTNLCWRHCRASWRSQSTLTRARLVRVLNTLSCRSGSAPRFREEQDLIPWSIWFINRCREARNRPNSSTLELPPKMQDPVQEIKIKIAVVTASVANLKAIWKDKNIPMKTWMLTSSTQHQFSYIVSSCIWVWNLHVPMLLKWNACADYSRSATPLTFPASRLGNWS